MNTLETDNDVLQFGETEAEFKPTLICVGQVAEVGDAHISESEKYVVQPIKIDALDAGKNHTVYFLYRPEWLTPGFKPHTLKKSDSGAHFVYSKNIASKDSFSVLRGLAGTKEAFGKLSYDLLSLPLDPKTGGPVMEDVTETLRNFFNDNVDNDGVRRMVGYELKQQATATGRYKDAEGREFDTNTDENGLRIEGLKQIYSRENNYNVAGFWDITTATIKRMKSRAEKSTVDEESGKKRIVFCYASGVPF